MSGRDSLTSASVQAGSDARVECYTYENSGPILTVDVGRTYLSISIAGRAEMPDPGVEFARALAREAQRFATECVRTHAAHQNQAQGASPAGVGDAA